MTNVFRTAPADAAVSDSGWCLLSPGLEVTREPLIDSTCGLYARLSQPDSEAACVLVGGRLPTHAEVLAELDASHLIPPYLMSFDHLMASRARCEEHDAAVREMLRVGVRRRSDWPETPAWDRVKPAGNIGKLRTFIPGMDPQVNEAITGWRKADGSLWQRGGGPIKSHRGAGAASRTDYGTTTIAVRDVARPPGAIMRSTIRLGATGADVSAWQKIIGVTADGIFGPLTAMRTARWQKDEGLHPDGVVGPHSWRAAGEVPATPAGRSASPACRRALRDADAAWPERRRASDGIMGDASHQARPSDHNLGNAVDITHDPSRGCDGEKVSDLALQDPRATYVIWDRRIANPLILDGAWRPYRGGNPHTSHVHVSVRAEARDDDSPWPWAPSS